jgi:hypothetical protein
VCSGAEANSGPFYPTTIVSQSLYFLFVLDPTNHYLMNEMPVQKLQESVGAVFFLTVYSVKLSLRFAVLQVKFHEAKWEVSRSHIFTSFVFRNEWVRCLFKAIM